MIKIVEWEGDKYKFTITEDGIILDGANSRLLVSDGGSNYIFFTDTPSRKLDIGLDGDITLSPKADLILESTSGTTDESRATIVFEMQSVDVTLSSNYGSNSLSIYPSVVDSGIFYIGYDDSGTEKFFDTLKIGSEYLTNILAKQSSLQYTEIDMLCDANVESYIDIFAKYSAYEAKIQVKADSGIYGTHIELDGGSYGRTRIISNNNISQQKVLKK